MIATHITHKGREIIHWLWLWTLVVIAMSVLQGRIRGQDVPPSDPSASIPADVIVDAKPIPIPNIDDPDLFRYPNDATNPNGVTVDDVLRSNRSGDFHRVIKAWQNLRMMDDSVTWKQVGIGAAYLQLNQLDQAIEHLNKAVKQDPTNAVAEYFLGRVRREQSRDVPFWFEMNDSVPFRLVAYNQKQPEEADRRARAQSRGKTVLPPFRNPTFDKQAERHFRRAIGLAPKCDLDRTINVVQPAVQFASQSPLSRPTVRDLLVSLGEENYVEKAHTELGEHLTIDE